MKSRFFIGKIHSRECWRKLFCTRACRIAWSARGFLGARRGKKWFHIFGLGLNPKSKSDVVRIVGVPPRGIGKVTLEKMFAGEVLGGAGAKVTAFQSTLAKIREAIKVLPASE